MLICRYYQSRKFHRVSPLADHFGEPFKEPQEKFSKNGFFNGEKERFSVSC